MRTDFLGIVLLLVAPGFAQVVSYDGTAFPDEVGWIRSEQVEGFLADRFLEDGCFVQTPEIVEGDISNEQDYYRYDLLEQAGSACWEMSWSMQTDGPLVPGAVAPAAIVAAGQSGILYHFTIGDDELVFNRGTPYPLVTHSFAPGVHEFRIEIANDAAPATYTFYFDGQVVDAGEAEGTYPTADSFVKFGARAAIVDSETRWHWIEFGPFVPEPILGDSDGDEDVDLDDLSVFQTCLSISGPGEPPSVQGCLESCDFDKDGDVDVVDYGGFQAAFTGAL